MESLEELKEYDRRKKLKSATVIISVAVLSVVTFLSAMMVGNYHLTISEILDVLFGINRDETYRYIILDVRVPRLICGFMVGASLALAGLVMQSLFKNPMASPSVLGISSGAAFGAALALAFGIGDFMGALMVPGMAFIFCLLTMSLVYLLARTKYGVASTTLLLAGVAVGAFFNGLVSLLQYIVNDDVLSSIVYWTMGSLNNCGWSSFATAIIPILTGIAMIIFQTKELNLISAGEEQASNMGLNVRNTRIILIVATSLIVGGSVAISGVIGFVGLIVPHIFRMLVGPNHKLLVPLCIVGGGMFMIIMDTISKSLFAMILPVGILTSLIGAPFFIYVMRTRKKEIWE